MRVAAAEIQCRVAERRKVMDKVFSMTLA